MAESPELSELQLSILRVLWSRGEASATEVRSALSKKRDLAITTISTLLTRLEKRGVVSHRSEGRLFVYRATITERAVRHSMLGGLLKSLYSGDPTAVVAQLVASRDVSAGDLDKMRDLIKARQKSGKSRG